MVIFSCPDNRHKPYLVCGCSMFFAGGAGFFEGLKQWIILLSELHRFLSALLLVF